MHASRTDNQLLDVANIVYNEAHMQKDFLGMFIAIGVRQGIYGKRVAEQNQVAQYVRARNPFDS